MKIAAWLLSEWTNTRQIGKSLVVVWFVVITLVYVRVMNVHPYYEYLRPRLILGWLYIWVLFVIVPFSVATMARRHGGRFNTWFVSCCLFAPIPYIIYWINVRKRPVAIRESTERSHIA